MDDERRLAARAARWGGWSVACGLALLGGWVTGQNIVIGVALLATLLCVSRWIEAARAVRGAQDAAEPETTDEDGDQAPRPSNIIRFRRPGD